jgi:hypothetical protein
MSSKKQETPTRRPENTLAANIAEKDYYPVTLERFLDFLAVCSGNIYINVVNENGVSMDFLKIDFSQTSRFSCLGRNLKKMIPLVYLKTKLMKIEHLRESTYLTVLQETHVFIKEDE